MREKRRGDEERGRKMDRERVIREKVTDRYMKVG